MSESPEVGSLKASDRVLAALRCSVDRLDADARSQPDAAFQQRTRQELLQSLAVSRLAESPPRPAGLAAAWNGMMHQRLAGIGVGVALFGLVAVPALAAPSSVAGAVTGAVGAVMRNVPPLLAGAPLPADQPSIPAKQPSSGVAAPAGASDEGQQIAAPMDGPAQNRGAAVSAAAHSVAEQEGGEGNAASAAVHTASSSLSVTTSDEMSEHDGHGDAVSSVAHQVPPAGETHGQQVSSVARSHAASSTATSVATSVATSTSHAGSDQHGAAVAAVAHAPAPTGETHGEQVSSVARGLTSSATSVVSTALTTTLLPPGNGGNGHGNGQPPKGNAGANGKAHGR